MDDRDGTPFASGEETVRLSRSGQQPAPEEQDITTTWSLAVPAPAPEAPAPEAVIPEAVAPAQPQVPLPPQQLTFPAQGVQQPAVASQQPAQAQPPYQPQTPYQPQPYLQTLQSQPGQQAQPSAQQQPQQPLSYQAQPYLQAQPPVQQPQPVQPQPYPVPPGYQAQPYSQQPAYIQPPTYVQPPVYGQPGVPPVAYGQPVYPQPVVFPQPPVAPQQGALAGPPGMLAGAADRERAVDVLKAAYGEGRITKGEFDHRISQVAQARTYADLGVVIADLPAGPLGGVSHYQGGIPAPAPYYPPARQTTNGLAVGSLVCALLGISLPAVIMGHVARKQIRDRNEGGDGLAIAGLIIGWLGMAFYALMFIAAIVAAGSGPGS